MTQDYAIHSDFLIHWTGRDIDEAHHPGWPTEQSPKTSGDCELAYLLRLGDILKYGLWLTVEPGTKYGKIALPDTPKCCFTELKLSQSRMHAKRYGCLGIGVKRPFVFQRRGRPLAYFGFDENSRDPLSQACSSDLADKRLLHFFKPMNSNPRPLNYDLYGESEWRMLDFEELREVGAIIDPRDPANPKEHEYFQSLTDGQKTQLRYLVPLDGWFAMIIYPSITIRNEAQRNSHGIAEEIRRIKSVVHDHGNMVERGSWPVEVDLDACRNF